MTTAREDLLTAGLAVFDRDGFEGATVAAIRTRARASNGSFFHFFGSKKELAGTLLKFSPVTTLPSSRPSMNPAEPGKAWRG
jgi:AcrR family transcriptional regulator